MNICTSIYIHAYMYLARGGSSQAQVAFWEPWCLSCALLCFPSRGAHLVQFEQRNRAVAHQLCRDLAALVGCTHFESFCIIPNRQRKSCSRESTVEPEKGKLMYNEAKSHHSVGCGREGQRIVGSQTVMLRSKG